MTTIVIPGIPQQQGSKIRAKTGHMYEANKKLAPWRADAIHTIRQAGIKHTTRPVSITAVFYFPRPASHYGTGRNAGTVKDSAPSYKPSTPDLDKLQRALGDALTQSGALRDDSQIVAWHASKVYAEQPATIVRIREVDQ